MYLHGASCRNRGKGDRMAEFQTVAKNFKRMCDSYEVCEGCPLTNDGSICSRLIIEHPKIAEHTIMQWAAGHPIMTNGMKFREVFGQPYEYLFEANGFIKQWLSQEYKGGQDG